MPDKPVRLHVATDGVEAMAFLRREGAHADAPRPDLILLDLNLPKMDGREVLALIKEDDSLKIDPDHHPDDVGRRGGHRSNSYQLQANAICESRHTGCVRNLVRSINDFWLTQGQVAADQAKCERRSVNMEQSASASRRRQSRRRPADAGGLSRRR